MWVVASVLLGLFAVLVVAGMRTGPHSHLVGAIVGAIAGVWLLIMGLSGHGQTVLWMLFAVDVLAALVIGLAARHALRHPAAHDRAPSIEGRDGIAVSDLIPDGVVRVGGEEWSATALNGSVARGERVQVVDGHGVRIGVWGLGALAHIPGDEPPQGGRKADPPW